MLDSTLIYCVGEFGRTPTVNRTSGRDHWPRSMAALLAGGGIKASHVHGATDANGRMPASDPCSPDDLAGTIFHCLGVEPNHEVPSSLGRPILAFLQGKVVEALVR